MLSQTSTPSVICWCKLRATGSPEHRAAMGCLGRVPVRIQCQQSSRDPGLQTKAMILGDEDLHVRCMNNPVWESGSFIFNY